MPLHASSLFVLIVSLAVVSIASGWLTSGLERIGSHLRFSEAILGILTALGRRLSGDLLRLRRVALQSS